MPNPMTGAGYGKAEKPKPTPTPIKKAVKHPMRDYGYTKTHYGSTFDKRQQAFLKQLQKMNKMNKKPSGIPASPTH
jgi:hypothetical protein